MFTSRICLFKSSYHHHHPRLGSKYTKIKHMALEQSQIFRKRDIMSFGWRAKQTTVGGEPRPCRDRQKTPRLLPTPSTETGDAGRGWLLRKTPAWGNLLRDLGFFPPVVPHQTPPPWVTSRPPGAGYSHRRERPPSRPHPGRTTFQNRLFTLEAGGKLGQLPFEKRFIFSKGKDTIAEREICPAH